MIVGFPVYFFEKIGIRIGQKILDFGCGKGNYTIPLAKAIGSGGIVYAIDKNQEALEGLRKKIYACKLDNVVIIHSRDKVKVPIGTGILDVVFLYDVLHPYYFSEAERQKLLIEVSRILKIGGLLSVYPKHMQLDIAKKAIERHDFRLESELKERLIHDNEPVEDIILNYRKTEGK